MKEPDLPVDDHSADDHKYRHYKLKDDQSFPHLIH